MTCEGSLYGIEGAASTNRFTGAVRKYFTTFNFFDTKTVVRVKGAEESIRKIKDLKEGFLSAVIHEITKMMIENNAIVVLEDLNMDSNNLNMTLNV